jgi:hypothetical protein
MDEERVPLSGMKHFNHDTPLLRMGSSDKLLHFIGLTEKAQGFGHPLAGRTRRGTAGAAKPENDLGLGLALHLMLSLGHEGSLLLLLWVDRGIGAALLLLG